MHLLPGEPIHQPLAPALPHHRLQRLFTHHLGSLLLVLIATGLGLLQPLPGIGHDVWIFAGLLTTVLWGFLRALVRGVHDFRTHDNHHYDTKLTLVVGAGRAGVLMVDEMQRHPELGSQVVGFIDDDFAKQGVLIHGVPVLGTHELIPRLVRERGIERIVLAIPSAPGPVMRQLSDDILDLGVEIKTVPGLFNLLGDHSWRPELRNVSIEDLLRREPVSLDQEGLRGALEDRVVLITGAGGSIGSELARQVCRFRPSRVVLLGRGENSLWTIERELRHTYPNQPLSLELCDVRSRRRLEQAFNQWKPTVVLHAAAHKHVLFLE
ncbi:MAG: polysaccharide biosynthesis protein [Holophaga sp.]|nr:polysaccharide biosynthesis protein [Holophaga sp.]